MKVTLIVAVTMDGFIARNPSHFTDWTDIKDKDFFHTKTQEIGTVVMGHNTFKTLSGPLPGRLNVVMSTSKNIRESIPGELEFFSGEPKELLEALATRGVTHVALVGGSQVAASFFVDDLIDDVYLTVTPVMFGQGISISSGYDFDKEFKLLDEQRIGDGSVLLHYEAVK